MRKGMLLILSSLLTLILSAGTAQALSIDFVGVSGSFNGSASGISGFSIPILVIATPPGYPGGFQSITGAMTFSTGSLISSVSTTGGFTNTYGAGGSLSITGTASGGATGTLLSATFAAPSTLNYAANTGGTLNSFLTNVSVNQTLMTSLFGPTSQTFGGGNISFSLNPSANLPSSTNFTLGIGSTNVVVGTPEPTSLLLLGSGLVGLGFWRWRKSQG